MDGTVRSNQRLMPNLEENRASIPPSVHDHHIRIYAAASSLIVILWVGPVLLVPDLHFVIITPRAKTGFEATLAFLQLFVALVLVLFPDKFERDRFRWLALGFLILGVGGLGFGYLLTLTDRAANLNVTMYGSLLTSLLSTLMIAIGLVPQRAPTLQTRRTVFVLGLFLSLGVATVLSIDYLPLLSTVDDLESAAASDAPVLEGLTSWHWGISLLPVAIGALAAIAAVRRPYGSVTASWLAISMVLLTGSQLHTMFWPSAYSPIMTTASFLRLAFTLLVAVGAVLGLKRVAAERAVLLAMEREATAQAAELARVRAEFTSMVGHELEKPLGAIRRAAELLSFDQLTPAQQRTLATITTEVELLDALIADTQVAARSDFTVHLVPVALDAVLADAVAYARMLPGSHPVTCSMEQPIRVLADPQRLAQVLRNLLNNAAKYSPPRAPILLEATSGTGRIRIAVVDRGQGIDPADTGRIFSRFARGRDEHSRDIPGLGLGLFLARQLVRSHGSELNVTSTPGEGATFWFELDRAP